MLRLNAFVPPDRADAVGSALTDVQGVRHVVLGGSTSEGLMCLTAEVDGIAADEAIELLAGFGLDWRNVTVSRAASIRPLDWHHHERSQDSDAHVWAEVVGRADENSQLAVAYLIFMISAGVISGIGVLTGSSVLVVGAMAISPDLLPISAAAIGLADHRWHLAGRAGRALAIGLITGAAAACAATAIVRIFGRRPRRPRPGRHRPRTLAHRTRTRKHPGRNRRGGCRHARLRTCRRRGRRRRHLRHDDPRRSLRRRRHRPRPHHPDVGCPGRLMRQRGRHRGGQHSDPVTPTTPATPPRSGRRPTRRSRSLDLSDHTRGKSRSRWIRRPQASVKYLVSPSRSAHCRHPQGYPSHDRSRRVRFPLARTSPCRNRAARSNVRSARMDG